MASRTSFRVVARIGNRLVVTQSSTRSQLALSAPSLSWDMMALSCQGKAVKDLIKFSLLDGVLLNDVKARSLNTSVYDKNVEDLVQAAVVPDEIVQPQSDKYWGPNPHTGVFGPDSEHNRALGGDRGLHTSPSNGGSESVLEQKAFFRPLEDLEKPEHP